MQKKLKVVNPSELSTIVYREDWTFEHVRNRPNNWFHPFKNGEIRRENRQRLMSNAPSESGHYYQPQAPPGSSTFQSQMPQYSYSMPPPPSDSGNVLSYVVYPQAPPYPYPGFQAPPYPGSQAPPYPGSQAPPYPGSQAPPYPPH